MSGGHHSDTSPAVLTRRLERLVEDRRLVDGAELDRILDRYLTTASPVNGARVVARAWVDDGFRRRLLEDANAAVAELGYAGGGLQPQVLRAVENDAGVHNVIVCTLCSCYPLALLGPSPSWYKSEAYRSRVVRNPRAVLSEFGFDLPDNVEIRVWDASAETRYLVVPRQPEGTGDLNEDQLASLVTRNGLIGTAPV